jgi:hypothetical protein
MSTEIPFELSQWQQSKLVEFVMQFDRTYGDGDFDSAADYSNPRLVALALRDAQLMGLGDQELEQFFEHEFGLAGLRGGELETMLAITMLIDSENRVRYAAGGRN